MNITTRQRTSVASILDDNLQHGRDTTGWTQWAQSWLAAVEGRLDVFPPTLVVTTEQLFTRPDAICRFLGITAMCSSAPFVRRRPRIGAAPLSTEQLETLQPVQALLAKLHASTRGTWLSLTRPSPEKRAQHSCMTSNASRAETRLPPSSKMLHCAPIRL